MMRKLDPDAIARLNEPDQGLRYQSRDYGRKKFDPDTGKPYYTPSRPATLTIYGQRAETIMAIIEHCETVAAALSPPTSEERVQAIDDIAAERRRQVESEDWTPEHDDEHGSGEMAKADDAYALHGRWFGHLHRAEFDPADDRGQRIGQADLAAPPQFWPWEWRWWKPRSHRENLVRAGALIVAEIERIDRAALNEGAGR